MADLAAGAFLNAAGRSLQRTSYDGINTLTVFREFLMVQPSPATPAHQDSAERRRFHHVREIFAEAHALIAPFFAPENQWANVTLDHLAYRVVRDHYPDLSFEEVHVLVVATKRVCTDRGSLPGAD